MRILFTSIILLFSLFVFGETAEPNASPQAGTAAAGSALKPEPAFTGEQVVVRKQIGLLFDESRKVNSSDPAERARVRKLIDTSFDWERIAQECLGQARWKKQSGANQQAFVGLLKEVIQLTAYGRLEKFWEGAQYRFDSIKLTGNTGVIVAQFLKEGDLATLEYKIAKKNAKWSIYDLSFEGEAYAGNINQQINGFLKDNSFSAFLDKMKKRRDELKAEPTTKS